jgi:hypothetical protein
MRAPISVIVLVLASLVLAGCSHNLHRSNAEQAYYNAQAAKAAERQPIVEFVARPGEAITLAGVERFAVYAPADSEPIRQYQAGPHPGVQALRILADAGLKGFGISRLADFGIAAIEQAGGNSAVTTTVGGNLGDTQTSIDESRTRIDDRSVRARDIRGDETYTRGDETVDSCIGSACRNSSPGPIDQSDNSDNSDNSTENPPPAPEPDPGGG